MLNKKMWVVGVFLGLMASFSFAQEGRFYGGIAVGQADTDVDEQDFAALNDGSLSNQRVDAEDTSLKLQLGYWAADNIGLELGYVDLGETQFDASSDGSGAFYAAGPVDFDIAIDGVVLGANFRLPINQTFALMTRLGVFKWDLEATLSNGNGRITVDDDGTDLYFGLGLLASISKDVALKLEFERYDIDDGDLDVLALGAEFNF